MKKRIYKLKLRREGTTLFDNFYMVLTPDELSKILTEEYPRADDSEILLDSPIHTQGDWSVPHLSNHNISCDCASVLGDHFFGSIASISYFDPSKEKVNEGDHPPREEAEINGRLISVSPLMHQLLVDICNWRHHEYHDRAEKILDQMYGLLPRHEPEIKK